MTKVYLIRHCESTANRDRVIQGTSEFDITPEGSAQLASLGKRFASIHIDKIYTSPLLRTCKTALAVKGERDIEIVKDIGFIEFNFGDIQGLNHQQFEKLYPRHYLLFKTAFYDMDAPHGQTYTEFYKTAWDSISRVAKENDGKTIAITSHGGTIRAILTRLLFDDITRVHETCLVSNTAVFEIDFYQDGTAKLKMQNDTSHLEKKAAVRLEI